MTEQRPASGARERRRWTVHPAIAIAAFFGGGVLASGVATVVWVFVLGRRQYSPGYDFVLSVLGLVPLNVINTFSFAVGFRFVPGVWWRHTDRLAWLAGGLGFVLLLITPLTFRLTQNFGCFLVPLIAAGVTVLALRATLRRGVLLPEPGPGVCVWCGHDLTGAISERCPECGEPRVGRSS